MKRTQGKVWRVLRLILPLLLPCLLAACGGGPRPLTYGSGTAQYAPPGPPADPWGPYITEAAARFDVPAQWIRAVMLQESGGHQYRHGRPITSDAGAMGLMQLMPATYGMLQTRYDLGPDPYQPRDNILAGAGYIRDLYTLYGSPAFLAAYDAGPGRLEAYAAGRSSLPNETINYLASVAPRLGDERPMTGPLAVYAAPEGEMEVATAPANDTPLPGPAAPRYAVAENPLSAAPAPPPPHRFSLIASADAAVLPPSNAGKNWAIQVGAYANPDQARDMADRARGEAPAELASTRTMLGTVLRSGTTLYRARLVGLSAEGAEAACGRLSSQSVACLAVPPGS